MENFDNNETLSICSQLNLNIDELKIQQLLNKPVYRRLYNIVQNDKNRNQYDYRKNLIKQLYFLLKITPIMKSQLRDVYLDKIQIWYNINDHKKTQLGSGGLKNLIQGYFNNKQKQSTNKSRPQSGIQWNKNVHPFLRPYTAARQTHYQNKLIRPDSHKSTKFGRSTVASTQLEQIESHQQQITIKDFNLSIQQQWQASQSFVNKNRTVHPQSQPIYEQLINLIKKAHEHANHTQNNEDADNQILFSKDRKDFFTSKYQQKHKQNNDQIKISIQQEVKNQQENIQPQNQDVQKVQEQSENSDDDSQMIQPTAERKIYIRDQNLPVKYRKSVDQFQFYKAQDKNDELLLKKVNTKYLNFTNQKIVNYSKNDNELVRHYVNFTRAKSVMKRQFNRKSQTKRLLSAKIKSTSNLHSSKPNNQRIYSAFTKKLTQKTENNEMMSNNFFDFSNGLSNKQNNNLTFINSSKYNQRTQLDQVYKRSIQNFKKFNKNSLCVAEIKCTDHDHLLTKYDSFLSRDKINPIADVHINTINEQALQQIQKIKERVAGMGKKAISTDSLMKALYINAYDNIQSCSTIGFGNSQQNQQNDKAFDWKNRNIYYNMLSDGTKKKLKKKPRKLKKKAA